ncbi:MAG: ATPase domain-containing protein [Infirmifilum sp.]
MQVPVARPAVAGSVSAQAVAPAVESPVNQEVYSPPVEQPEESYADPASYAAYATEEDSYNTGLSMRRLDLLAPTGVPGLDDILAGGFLRGKTYLVAGEAGCGKTIFSIQFLIHGALHGEPGLYIAIDEPTNQLLRGLRLFGWDLGDLIASRRLMFLDMRTHFSKIYLRDERKHIEPRYIIEQILNAAKKQGAKRLVIDPIAPLVYGGKEEDVLYAREFLREMVFAIEKTGELTTIMTSEIPTGSTKLSRFGVEEFLASGIIVLGIEEIYGNVERIMYIRKARWAPVKPSKYIFDIVSGKGIVIREPLSDYLKRLRTRA